MGQTHLQLKPQESVTYPLKPLKLFTGWPNKNSTFLRYHIFAATTHVIMLFLLKCSEITAEKNR